MPRHTLTPEDGRKGALAVAALKQERRMDLARRTSVVDRIVSELDDVAPAALDAVLAGLARGTAALDDVPIDDALDAKRVIEAAEIAHRVYRLATGQSTSNTAHATLTDEERRERMARLRGDVPGDTHPTA